MGVDLRRRDVGMAQQRLQHAQVGPARQQMRGKGVAQDVRADPLGRDPGQPGQRADDLVQPHPAQMRLAAREQPRPRRRRRGEPVGDGLLGARRDRREPLLVALAADHQERLAGAHRAPRQRHQFGRAQSRPVEQFDQRQVAQRQRPAARRALLDRREHRLDLVRVEDLGQAAAGASGAAARATDRRSRSPSSCRKP